MTPRRIHLSESLLALLLCRVLGRHAFVNRWGTVRLREDLTYNVAFAECERCGKRGIYGATK